LQDRAALSYGLVAPKHHRHGAEHEHDGAPGGGFRKDVGRATRAKGSLAACATECTREVRRLAALEQDDDDQHETVQDEKTREQPAGKPETQSNDAESDQQGHGPLHCRFCIHFKILN